MVTGSAQTRFPQDRQVLPKPPGDERTIIAAAQNSDASSFGQLMQTYQLVVFHTAFRILGDLDSAADATQEAFISAYKHLNSFRGGSFKAWLLRIVTNACYDQLRAKQRRPVASLEAVAVEGSARGAPPETVATESPEDIVQQRELSEVIQKGLQSLSVDQRIAVILSDVDGFSYEEIARITATNVGTVKSRLSRGRNQLRDFLIGQGEFPKTCALS